MCDAGDGRGNEEDYGSGRSLVYLKKEKKREYEREKKKLKEKAG